MKNAINVKAIWEFEVDVEDLDEKHVDIKELAKDLTQRELKSLLQNQEISTEDFSYEVEEEIETEQKINGIIFKNGKDDFELWEGFVLSKEDHNAIEQILRKYTTDGCSIRGTRKDISKEIGEN